MLEIRLLKYFLAVAREQSISGAAESLYISQPTLSRQLMDLEKDLGKRLFIRGNRRITLTEDGMLFRKRAEEIMDLVEKTEAELSAETETIKGDVYIGSGETASIDVIADTIAEIQAEYPEIHYHIFSGNKTSLTDRLDKGLDDYGVLLEKINTNKYDSIKLPSSDRWGVLARKDMELAKSEFVSPADLQRLPLICSKEIRETDELGKLLSMPHGDFNIIGTYNLLYNASLLVKAGVGYALCIDRIINTHQESELCFIPIKPQISTELYLIWKKGQIFSRASQIFLERLKEKIST